MDRARERCRRNAAGDVKDAAPDAADAMKK
ncbi:hypothetical protein ACVWXO_005656 [Bradyrhizobium sp. LM2.7]